MSQALRYPAGGDFHHAYGESFGFETQQYAASFQNENNFGLSGALSPSLSQLLGRPPLPREPLGPSHHGLQDLQHFHNFSLAHSPFHSASPLGPPAPPPNSTFGSPAFAPSGRGPPSCSARRLFEAEPPSAPPAPPAPRSDLGLADIFSRLDRLRQDLPAPAPPQPAPPALPMLSSRGSTPLSWNPLGTLSCHTPLSSLTPSPTPLPAPPAPSAPQLRPLMEQKLDEEFIFQDREVKTASPAARRTEAAGPLRPLQKDLPRTVLGIAKLPPVRQEQAGGASSWSQIVRSTSSPRLTQPSPAGGPRAPSPLAAAPVPPSPPALTTPNSGLPDYHRGPRVDSRWPVQQQVFLGPIPMAISWDEIRNAFYAKVSRKELLHFYVQSKPVNEVVYGQVVFDKASLANKILREGSIKVRGQYITMTAMGEKMKQMKLEKQKK